MKLKQSFALLLSLLPASLAANVYELDKTHSNINFEVDHLAFSTVKGRFDEFFGGFEVDPKSKALSRLEGRVGTASINTDNEKRDKHLKSDDFFSAQKFKEMKVEFPPLNIKAGQRQTVKAKLTIRDVTKEVPFEVNYRGSGVDPWGTEKAGVRATAEINRKDFGLGWNEVLETGGVLVGEMVKIEINLQGNKKAEKKAEENARKK
jgi:polyisoprenoid-binding protein YceI